MAKKGRPTKYTEEIADEICKLLSEGKSMRSVCLMEEMPEMPTVWRWIKEREDFRKQYERACDERTEAHNEMLIQMGDVAIAEAKKVDPKSSNAVVSAYKLKADNLKWSMSKMKPKKYGDKLDMTTNGKDLPTPILGNVIPSNNSNKKDSILAEEN